MSLKTFHLVFVTASTLLAVGFAVWEALAYAERREAESVILGAISILLAVTLVIYGLRVRRKLKEMPA